MITVSCVEATTRGLSTFYRQCKEPKELANVVFLTSESGIVKVKAATLPLSSLMFMFELLLL